MTLPKDILELRDKRDSLENEKRSLEEEKRKKRERLKALEQMIIVELANSNEKTRQDLSQLDSNINDLEKRLEQARQEAESMNDESAPASVQVNAVIVGEPMEEEASTKTTSDSSEASSENQDEETRQRNAKKKREIY